MIKLNLNDTLWVAKHAAALSKSKLDSQLAKVICRTSGLIITRSQQTHAVHRDQHTASSAFAFSRQKISVANFCFQENHARRHYNQFVCINITCLPCHNKFLCFFSGLHLSNNIKSLLQIIMLVLVASNDTRQASTTKRYESMKMKKIGANG